MSAPRGRCNCRGAAGHDLLALNAQLVRALEVADLEVFGLERFGCVLWVLVHDVETFFENLKISKIFFGNLKNLEKILFYFFGKSLSEALGAATLQVRVITRGPDDFLASNVTKSVGFYPMVDFKKRSRSNAC